MSRALRVLMVNKFHFVNGGSEVNYFGLTDLLREHGHHVGHFSMRHPANRPSEYAEYFVRNVDYDRPGGLLAKARLARNTVYCREARVKIAQLLDDAAFDLVHLHNFHHQITPSILPEIKRRGLPIVFTLHDYKVVCPNYRLRTHDGVCERCKGGRFYQAAVHRCTKDSRAASLVNTVEMYFHRFMRYDALYDAFIAPSRFTAAKVIEFGLPAEKVRYVPNFVRVHEYETDFEPGDYFLYLGRLAPEKGVGTLIAAMQQIPEAALRIAGQGPCEEQLRALVKQSGTRNVEFVGHLTGDDLKRTVRGARALVVPSEWYENCPLAVIEAYAAGKPAIAARIGGLAEMVADGETGYSFEAGDIADLVRALRRAMDDADALRAMGGRARQRAEQEYDASQAYPRIMDVYERLLAAHEGNRKADV